MDANALLPVVEAHISIVLHLFFCRNAIQSSRVNSHSSDSFPPDRDSNSMILIKVEVQYLLQIELGSCYISK